MSSTAFGAVQVGQDFPTLGLDRLDHQRLEMTKISDKLDIWSFCPIEKGKFRARYIMTRV
jgi:hypothetical protein